MKSLAFSRLSLLCGLLLWSGAAMGVADAASTGAVEEAEPNDTLGVLEFRIAPHKPGSGTGPSPLTTQEIDQCRKDLTENGPSASMKRHDEFVWMKIMQGVELPTSNPYQITQEHQGVGYLLVHNWPPFVMSSDMGWGLQSVSKDTKDAMGRAAIGFQFDRDGGSRFYYLTSANIDQALAIIIEGEVVSVPHIATAVSSQAAIPGSFTTQQIDDMTKDLQKIVRPASTPATTTTSPARSALRIYLIPLLIVVLAVAIVGLLVYR